MMVLVLAGQIGCIFWLAARKPEPPLPPVTGPVLYQPTDQIADLPGVTDPTLFILHNEHGFSGPAWLQFPPANYALEPWTEPARPLELSLPQLGATLREFAQADRPRPFEMALKPEPQLSALGYLPLGETPSTFTIEGDVAGRALLTPLQLQSWPAADILTNSEVQIAVDAAGRVFSAALIGGSGSPQANSNALSLVRSARFQPLRWVGDGPPPASPGRLSWGKIIFRWHTVALPATTGQATK
jgi:TonB family protein